MIAPLRDTPTAQQVRRQALGRARRAVAESLLRPRPQSEPAPRVPLWQAWLLAAWMVLVAAAYVLHMLG